MALFVSNFTNAIDKKGRVSFPAPFRAALADQATAGFILYPSFTSQALEGCSPDFMETLAATTQSNYDLFSPEQDDLATLIFSASQQLCWDGDGRIVLPADLLAHAGVTDKVTFVGKGRTFQLWQPDAFAAHIAQARARALQNRPKLMLGGAGK